MPKLAARARNRNGRAGRSFPPGVVERALLWCDRHCCLCGKPCGTSIEVHHIEPIERGGDGSQDNAIPLCFDCHAKVELYNHKHPLGRSYRARELTRRRDQIYDEHTRHLVPGIRVEVRQTTRDGEYRRLPDVGCTVVHKGNGPQVRILIRLDAYRGNNQGRIRDNHYGGTWAWNLNRDQEVWGHFYLPKGWTGAPRRVKVVANVTVIDVYERHHALLPMGFIYMPRENDWYYEPCPDRA